MKDKNNTDHIDPKTTNIVVNMGLFYNVLLALGKTVFGIMGHSGALLADGINSTSDVVYYIAVKIFLKIANQPADKEHPFGHKQMEQIATIVIASFIITTAIVITWKSLDYIFDIINGTTTPRDIANITLYIALFTIVSKIFLFIYAKMAGKKTKNPAVIALASDHLNDIFAASAVVIGIVCAVKWNYIWVDPLAGIVVSGFILKTGVEILKDAAAALMDVAPTPQMAKMVEEYANEINENIIVEDIISHRYGCFYSLTITLAIEPNITIKEADKIANKFEKELIEKDNFLKYVFIHYHPKK